jgi:N4-gp56 family major capsid protein
MAATDFPVGHPLAVKLWSKKIAREALKETMASKFMGTSSNNMIQVFDDTSKGSGDKITVPLRMQLSGRGVGELDSLEGNEEALTTLNDSVLINDLAHAVRVKATIDAQRVPFSVREEASQGIADWYADRIDQSLAYQLTGWSTITDQLYTGNNAAVAPSSGTGVNRRHIIRQQDDETDHTSEASLSTSDSFSLKLLDRAVAIAKLSSPLIRPIQVGSQKYYVAFLHPLQVKDMRTNTNTGDWLDIQKAAMTGGEVMDNPIFTGALGVYNGVVLHEWTRLPTFATGASGTLTGARGVFCGAQAAAMAWGKGYSEAPKYIEENFDYERQMGFSVQTIMGAKKLQFNSKDFGTIAISTIVTAA